MLQKDSGILDHYFSKTHTNHNMGWYTNLFWYGKEIKRKANWIGHILRRNCLLKQVIEGKIKGEMEVTRRRGTRRGKLLDELKDRRGYSHLKEEALDSTVWRNRFGGCFGPVVRQSTEWWWYSMNAPRTGPRHFCRTKYRALSLAARWIKTSAEFGGFRWPLLVMLRPHLGFLPNWGGYWLLQWISSPEGVWNLGVYI